MTEEALDKFCEEVMELGYAINKDQWREYFRKLETGIETGNVPGKEDK